MSGDLLQTKLYVPRLRPSLIPRPHLIEKLNRGLQQGCKLTLVSAPAGFGKTTLVSEWIAGCERPFAWLSLDKGDADLQRFLTYFIAALQTVLPAVGTGMMVALQSPQSPPIESSLTTLLNEIAGVPDNFLLVLDDYHLVDAQPVDKALTFLLDHLPPQMHLVITTREDPNLPLSRLRVRGQLTEIRAVDLRFTLAETAVFLNQIMGLAISPEELAALEKRTEGWIAALQVAALSLQGRDNTTAFIRQFSGSHRHILDYLAAEVLAQQPTVVQRFLLYTSILDRFCAPLCDAVVQRDPLAVALLEHLERANLFLIPLDDDRYWYRYHPLFADFLQGRLQKVELDIIPELHRRASLWFEENEYWETAVHHALAAQSFDRARQLIERYAPQQPTAGISFILFRWLQQLPAEMVRARPGLSLALAWGYCRSGQYQTSEVWLEAAEAHQPAEEVAARTLWGEAAAVRSIIACFQGNTVVALTQSRTALDLLPQDHHILRGLIANNIAMNLGDAISSSSDLAMAGQIYAEVAAAGQSARDDLVTAFALNRLAQLQISRGALRQAADTCRQVLALPLGSAERPSLECSLAHLNLAAVLYQWNRLDEAEQHAATAEVGKQSGENAWFVEGYRLRALLAQARGDEAGAQAALAQAAAIVQKTNVTWIVSGIAAAKVRLALMQGDMAMVVRWADTCGLAVGDDIGIHRSGEYATLARIRLAQGETTLALALLDWLFRFVTRLELAGEVLELLLLKALAHQASDELTQAVADLEEALHLAEPEGYVRIFLDEGEAMCLLLRRAATAGIMPGYIGRLLAAFPRTSSPHKPQPLIDPLSDRELDVLRLLADGRTNPEIAAELFLAVGTVKRHVHNILGKLNVANRREAVRRARELALL